MMVVNGSGKSWIVLLCLIFYFDVVTALRPEWPPTYQMNRSTYSGYMDLNYTGLANAELAANVTKHGLITISWMTDICHNSVSEDNDNPCETAHTDDTLRTQAAQLKVGKQYGALDFALHVPDE